MQLRFTTTDAWTDEAGFGCASLGLAGTQEKTTVFKYPVEGTVLTGDYETVLTALKKQDLEKVQAAIILFGNAGGENAFMQQLKKYLRCPVVGGGAAIDGATGKSALLTGGSPAALLLITDDRYTYEAQTLCIHSDMLETCDLTLGDPRTLLTINGKDAATYLSEKKAALGLPDGDFEHLTLTDLQGVNAHLSKPVDIEQLKAQLGRMLASR